MKKTYFLKMSALLVALLASACSTVRSINREVASSSSGSSGSISRMFYVVGSDGSISVYDMDSGHSLVKKINTVNDVYDVRGAVASPATGKLYVSYQLKTPLIQVGEWFKIYCLDLTTEKVLWDKMISPGADRLTISPDGNTLYVPTGEMLTNYDFINVLDAATGDVKSQVHFSHRSHNAQYPQAGPLFVETKDRDPTGKFIYEIDPKTLAVKGIGPFSDYLGPYAVDSTSTYIVANVLNVWGMQVGNLRTGAVVTAPFPNQSAQWWGQENLLHGIGWTPDQKFVWQASGFMIPQVYIWDMTKPMSPQVAKVLTISSARGSHWLTFSIKGDFAYVSPYKPTTDPVEVFNTSTYESVGNLVSSEHMMEIDFQNGKIVQVGDQFGIGRE